jgi:hypothetical protein
MDLRPLCVLLGTGALVQWLSGAVSVISVFTATSLGAAFGFTPSTTGRWSSTTVSVRYDSPSRLSLAEPVVVKFTVENQGEQPIRIDLGFDRTENFVVTVIDPAGTPHTATLLKRCGPDCAGRGGRIVVPPSQSFSHQLMLNDWFRFDRIGIYLVEFRLKTPVTTDAGAPIDVPAGGTLAVEVRPRNEAELEALCRRLARTIVETNHAARRMDAARALSRVLDPVAVRYIAVVLERTDMEDSRLIPALARIGGSEALAMLKQLENASDSDRASLASRALKMRVIPKGT